MLQVTPHMRLLVCVDPVDFRNGIDGLVRVCRETLGEDPFRGTRPGTRIKLTVEKEALIGQLHAEDRVRRKLTRDFDSLVTKRANSSFIEKLLFFASAVPRDQTCRPAGDTWQ
ncbi:MAG: transposase [Planctomycetes bacterium]|nr:transposase [Planctomycetota bacterium]